jgi:hypothetical protein
LLNWITTQTRVVASAKGVTLRGLVVVEREERSFSSHIPNLVGECAAYPSTCTLVATNCGNAELLPDWRTDRVRRLAFVKYKRNVTNKCFHERAFFPIIGKDPTLLEKTQHYFERPNTTSFNSKVPPSFLRKMSQPSTARQQNKTNEERPPHHHHQRRPGGGGCDAQ